MIRSKQVNQKKEKENRCRVQKQQALFKLYSSFVSQFVTRLWLEELWYGG